MARRRSTYRHRQTLDGRAESYPEGPTGRIAGSTPSPPAEVPVLSAGSRRRCADDPARIEIYHRLTTVALALVLGHSALDSSRRRNRRCRRHCGNLESWESGVLAARRAGRGPSFPEFQDPCLPGRQSVSLAGLPRPRHIPRRDGSRFGPAVISAAPLPAARMHRRGNPKRPLQDYVKPMTRMAKAMKRTAPVWT